MTANVDGSRAVVQSRRTASCRTRQRVPHEVPSVGRAADFNPKVAWSIPAREGTRSEECAREDDALSPDGR